MSNMTNNVSMPLNLAYEELISSLEKKVGLDGVSVNIIQSDYFKQIKIAYENNSIKLLIVGESPYLTNASDIPFCKKSPLTKRDSGFEVFKFLIRKGYIDNSSIEESRREAVKLSKKGIIFLNSCYMSVRDGVELCAKEKKIIQENSDKFNKLILDKIKCFDGVICIGSVARRKVADLRLIHTKHTSGKNSNNPNISKYAKKIEDLQ